MAAIEWLRVNPVTGRAVRRPLALASRRDLREDQGPDALPGASSATRAGCWNPMSPPPVTRPRRPSGRDRARYGRPDEATPGLAPRPLHGPGAGAAASADPADPALGVKVAAFVVHAAARQPATGSGARSARRKHQSTALARGPGAGQVQRSASSTEAPGIGPSEGPLRNVDRRRHANAQSLPPGHPRQGAEAGSRRRRNRLALPPKDPIASPADAWSGSKSEGLGRFFCTVLTQVETGYFYL